MNIEEKIEDLFALRRIPELLGFVSQDKQKGLSKKLIGLQKSIYDLDLLLESNWKIEHSELNKKWLVIFKLLKGLGVASSDQENYVNAIKRYQKHELQLRQGKLPIEYTLEYYYYYKSCDIKLLRRLIYDISPEISKVYQLKDWRLFDLITEIYDDVEDVFEDQNSINGNAFLLNINSRGLEATVMLYQDFINEVEWRLDEKFSKSKKASKKQIYSWTKQAIMHLNIMILKQADKLKGKGIQDCLVIKNLSVEYSV